MSHHLRVIVSSVALVVVFSLIAVGLLVEAGEKSGAPKLSVAEARGRATLLHGVYSDSLRVIHRSYFREDEKLMIPSKALEDVFAEMKERDGIKARWLAVNAEAMSVDHKPQDAFERQAADALSSGKTEFESIEKGIYRRVGSIKLENACLRCHFPLRTGKTRNRVAGLVISIPVQKQ